MQLEKRFDTSVIDKIIEHNTYLEELQTKIANSPVIDKIDYEMVLYHKKHIEMYQYEIIRGLWNKRPSLLNRIFRKE